MVGVEDAASLILQPSQWEVDGPGEVILLVLVGRQHLDELCTVGDELLELVPSNFLRHGNLLSLLLVWTRGSRMRHQGSAEAASCMASGQGDRIGQNGPMKLSPAAAEWRTAGFLLEVQGHNVFATDQGAATEHPPVLVLHGFPGSSYDWRAVLPAVAHHTRVVAFDQLGYGLSDKPVDARYSLFDYADLAESVARQLGIDDCLLVAHDVGDTVAAELLARVNEGRSRIGVVHTVLTNGSIFIDMAQLSAGQLALLSMPDEVLSEPMPLGALTPGLRATFAPQHLPEQEVLTAMEDLIRCQDGDRLLPRLIRYIEERRRNQPRWTAGLVDHGRPLTALWGELDPIAVPAMVDRLRMLRPSTTVVTWPDVGHWPSLEVPDRVADAIVQALSRCPADG